MTSVSTWITGVLVGIATIAVATIVGFVFDHNLGQPDVAMIQLLGIVVVAMRFPIGPAFTSAILSVLSFDFFFIPPRFEFAWTDTKSSVTVLAMVVTSLVVAHVNQSLRTERRRALVRERTTASLFRLSGELAAAGSPEQVCAVAARGLSTIFELTVFVVAELRGSLAVGELARADVEAAEACWRTLAPIFSAPNGSGRSTLWTPLVTAHKPVGALGLSGWSDWTEVEPTTRETVARCAQVVGTALERMALTEAARQAEVRVEIEQVRNSLLSSISHDLRSPLASIVTAGSVLLKPEGCPEPERTRIAQSIVEEADRLSRLTTNLLELARLRTGHIDLRRAAVPVDELLEAGLHRLRSRLEGREVSVDLPEEMVLVSVDRMLMEQVVVNLLENAIRYAPASALELSAVRDGDSVLLSIADRGPGLGPGEEERVFERFYRGASASAGADGGLGLGLTIARMIVESHGGILRVENRPSGGVIARVRLPRAHEVTIDLAPRERSRGRAEAEARHE